MKINLQQLLPAEMPDEAAFHLANFVRNLAVALEASYFDQILVYNVETVSYGNELHDDDIDNLF